MQGATHELITSVTVISPSGEETFSNTTKLTMRSLTADEITRYVDLDMPLDCAGSYKLESAGIKLFSKIEMDDHTSIIGLPLIQLTTVLHKFGFPIY
jgi:septum formation protein